MKINVVLDKNAKLPQKAHNVDAGFDLFSKESKIIRARSHETFDTGVHMEIPEGYVGFLKSKSGLNVKFNLTSEGVIDCGYTGSIIVKIYNHGDQDYIVAKGDKITQIVILPIPEVELNLVDELNTYTERGSNGFGSTGK